MHVFLTGPKGIGKSTLINKTLDLLEDALSFEIGGFITHNGPKGDSNIYISPASNMPYYSAANKIASRGNIIPTAYPMVFEGLGVQFLEESKKSDLLLMDELGFLEEKASSFQKTVLQALEGSIPILGTLRLAEIPWLNQIKNHNRVTLFKVSLDNRDELAGEIFQILHPLLEKKAKQG